MNGNVFLSVALTAAATLQFSATLGFAGAGGEGVGGGERYAAHFAQVGKRIDLIYKQLCADPAPEARLVCKGRRAFADAVKTARIFPRDGLVGADGQPREAGPDGYGNTELNVPLYQSRIEKPGSAEGTATVVVHEYMILAHQEVEDSYVVSSMLMNALKANFLDFSSLVPPAPARPETEKPTPEKADVLGQVGDGAIYYFSGQEESAACAFQVDVDLSRRTLLMTAVHSNRNRDRLLCPDTGVFLSFSCDVDGLCNQTGGRSLCRRENSTLQIVPGGRAFTTRTKSCYDNAFSRN